VQPWRLEPARDLGLGWQKGVASLRRENGLVATGLHFFSSALLRGYFALWHRLEVRGAEHLPAKPPFVLAANHASHLDALVLASALPWRLCDRVFPIAAGDVFFDSSMRGAFSALVLNALPMWRGRCGAHALKELRSRLVDEPCGYILFPEGKRSRDGRMNPFKTGLGMIVAGADVPVVPCFLEGPFAALRAGQWLPRPRKIRAAFGPPLRFAHLGPERSSWETIAAEVERAVQGLAV
jgi:1-acyl-sn-glycerol-3-phosphate acyltransferase